MSSEQDENSIAAKHHDEVMHDGYRILPPCGVRTLGPDDEIRPCPLPAGHAGFHDPRPEYER